MSLPAFLQTSPPPAPSPSQARLKALYASTSLQSQSNPTGYQANLQWWSSMIDETLRAGYLSDDRLILHVDGTLSERFENAEGARPRGLGGVIDSMLRPPTNRLMPLQAYMNSPTPIRDPGSLTYRFIARPLLWGLSKVNPFGGGTETVEKEEIIWKRVSGKEYAHLTLIEKAAALVIQDLEDDPPLNYSDSLFTFSSFRDKYGSIAIPSRADAGRVKKEETGRLSEKDVEVLVKWLSRDAGVLITDGIVIKVLSMASEAEITEADRGTVTILSTIKTVEKQINSLTSQIDQYTTLAKEQLRKSQKSLALSSLRSKKHLEDILTKRLATSHQLTTVLTSINTAQDDIGIVSAYETATRTLKGILAHPSLDLAKVEQTTEDLAEALAGQEEVDAAISVGGAVAVGAGGVVVDDDELEKELEGLVLDEQAKQAERRREEVETERKRAEKAEREKAESERSKTEESRQKQQSQELQELGGVSIGRVEEDEWQKTYEAAQQRRQDEARRAEEERLKREERRVAAE